MRIWLHLGSRSGTSDKLTELIKKNSDLLTQQAVKFFLDGSERQVLRGLANGEFNIPAEGLSAAKCFSCDRNESDVLLDSQHFMGAPNEILGEYELYPQAEHRLKRFVNAFPKSQLEIILVVQPISILVASVENLAFQERIKDMGWEGAYELSWFNLAQRMRAASPSSTIHILDLRLMPVFLPLLVRKLLGTDGSQHVYGQLSWLEAALAGTTADVNSYATSLQTGVITKRLRQALATKSKATLTPQRMQFLQWDDTVLELLDNNYRSDLQKLRALRNVSVWG